MSDGSAVIRLALPGSGREFSSSDPDPAPVERLLSEAERLGILPAVLKNLGRDDNPRIREITARNLWLRQEQARLLALLAAEGVRAHGVKGVALAEQLYPDLCWREVGDIDLLVSKQQAGRAFEILRCAGLTPNHNWNAAGLARQLKRTVSLAPELILTTAGGLMVELHWDWPADTLPTGDLPEQPEHYLVYLCRHAGKHFWSSLKWSCDIELFLRRYGSRLNWPLFWRAAADSGAERSCAVSLELCRRWFGGAAAPGLAAHSSRRIHRLAERAATELLNPAASRSHPVWTQIRLADWRSRLGMVRAWLSPQPQDWNRAEERQVSFRRLLFERAKRLWVRWAPHRASSLSAADWGVLFEAYLTVAIVEAARRILPSRRLLGAVKSGTSGAGSNASWTLERLRRVAWLVDAAANRQPVTIRCLTRSLALARMLQRRGVGVELRLGVKREEGRMQAHAWVEWQGEVLNDPMGRASDHVVLAGAEGKP